MSRPTKIHPARKPWYDSAFRRDYLELYSHRNQAAARAEVEFIMANTPTDSQERILDIACGAGRHLVWLSSRARLAVGLDRSADLLAEAAARLPRTVLLVRADMRALPFTSEFTCVTLLFTSFGYFQTDSENLSVISQAAGVLKPGGVFWLDYLNESHVRRTLEPFSKRTTGDLVIEQRRRITEQGRVEKQVKITGENGQHCHSESVKLYSRLQVEQMFADSGLGVAGVWGDFQGREHFPDSPRLIISGYKNG